MADPVVNDWMTPSDAVTIPRPYSHLFMPRGRVDLEDVGLLVKATPSFLPAVSGQKLTAAENAEVLVSEMHARAT